MKRRSALQLMASAVLAASAPAAALSAAEEKNATIAGRVVDAETGRVIPCTVTILTSNGSVITQSQSFIGGFRSTGRFEKVVPPGETTVMVSRGFDYEAQRRRLLLAPGERAERSFELRRRAHMRRRGWYCGDSHDHMIHGQLNVPVDFPYTALAARAVALDYMCLAQNWTLPNPTPERLEAHCRKLSSPDFTLTWNMEAPKTYWHGDVTHCLGHGWTLGMRGYTPEGQDVIQELFQMNDLDYQSKKPLTPNFETHALVHAQGGIVSYTHPCRWWWGDWGGEDIYPVELGKFISNLAQELPYDTVVGPTYDTIDILMQPEEKEANREAQALWFTLLNKGYRLPATASTDTTFNNVGAGVPGRVRVYTRVEGEHGITRIADAMKAGRNFVTSGPLLLLRIGDYQAGDVIPVDGQVSLTAAISAWASGAFAEYLTRVELIRNGAVLKSFPIEHRETGFKESFEVHETETAWYVARCFGSDESQVAITNPVYFEAKDYQAPQPAPARVTATITEKGTAKPLDGECEVFRMAGASRITLARKTFSSGRLTLDVPGTARLTVQAPGYAPMTKSVFLDYPPLVRLTVNLRRAELTDWSTFEEIRRLLRNVRLRFELSRSA